jgi:D-arabinose 1-dehydrogenase-like Zn-dependent alcohol dehydrogenase
MSTVPKQIAIIAYGPHRAGQWKLRDVVSRSLGEKEVLVEIVASGICHSDLHFADSESGHGVHYPRVMGHEGYISSFCKSLECSTLKLKLYRSGIRQANWPK